MNVPLAAALAARLAGVIIAIAGLLQVGEVIYSNISRYGRIIAPQLATSNGWTAPTGVNFADQWGWPLFMILSGIILIIASKAIGRLLCAGLSDLRG